MMQKSILQILFIMLLPFLFVNTAFSQKDSTDKVYYHSHSIVKKRIPAPSAVLVQLKSGHNRLVYFSKHHDKRDYDEVVKEIKAANEAAINDFQDHFSYCPVYYYVDTNVHFIKDKQFDGVLLNADGSVATNIAIPNGDTTFLIVIHGYPRDNPYSFPVKVNRNGESDYAYGSGYPFGKGLLILNHDFIQIDFFYRLQWTDPFRKPKKKYEYRAKKFDIDYYPLAAEFDKALKTNLPK